MGLREVNRVRRRVVGILCACFILLVLVLFEASWIDYYFFPSLAATPDKVVLIYRRNPEMGSAPSSYIHTSPDGVNWSEAVYLPFDPGPAQVIGDKLYVVRPEHYSVFDLNSVLLGEQVDWHSGDFKLKWKVALALPEGESLRLLGTEEVDEDRVRIREAVLSDSVIRELPHSVEIDKPKAIAACSYEGDVYFLHRAQDEDTVHLLRRKAQAEWEEFGEVPGTLVLFDCAGAAGMLHIVGTPVRYREKGSWRLVHYEVATDGSVNGPVEFQHNLTTSLGWPRGVSEVWLAGRGDALHLAGRFGSVVATSLWRGGAWREFTTVNRVPLATRVVMWSWFSGLLVLCGALVWTGFELFLAKHGRSKTEPAPEPVAVELVSILRRVAAYLVDFIIVFMVMYVVGQPAQSLPGGRSALEVADLQHPMIFSLIALLYFVLPEAVFGQTLGKGLLGIVVKGEDGRRAGLWPVILRNLFKLLWPLLLFQLVPPVLVIEYLVLISTKKSQRLGDIVAGTVVVKKGR